MRYNKIIIWRYILMLNKTNDKNSESYSRLKLPKLHYVVTDQWIDVIGEKALMAWLKMYTMREHDQNNYNTDPKEEVRVPKSLNQIIKNLRVGRDTFYNQILKPLWNVGLVDLVEYEDFDTRGNKPVNVIVYSSPQNNPKLATQELTIIRDYDKDYHSDARAFAKLGGRPKEKK